MGNILDRIRKLYDDADAKNSKVIERCYSEERRERAKCISDYETTMYGAPYKDKKDVKDISIRLINNDKYKYYAEDIHYTKEFDGFCSKNFHRKLSAECRRFLVFHGEDDFYLYFVHKKGLETEIDGKNKHTTYLDGDFVKLESEGKHNFVQEFGLDGTVDLSDINAIRYAVKDKRKVAHLLDKFFIVTPEERKAYKEYEAKRDKEAAKEQQTEKTQAKGLNIRKRGCRE